MRMWKANDTQKRRKCICYALFLERNRQAPNLRSPLALVPVDVLLLPDTDNIPVDISTAQRRPGPDTPQWKIPHSEWLVVLQRVEQGETYRQVASSYGVSYEAVRRV